MCLKNTFQSSVLLKLVRKFVKNNKNSLEWYSHIKSLNLSHVIAGVIICH